MINGYYNKILMSKQQAALNFLQQKSYSQFRDLNLQAYTKLEELGPYLIDGEKSLRNMSIGWMDSIFRPGNEDRRQTALNLNKEIQTKVAKLKSMIMLRFREITAEKYEEIKKTVDNIKKLKITIEQLSLATRIILMTAIQLIITLLSVVAIIASGSNPFGWLGILTSVGAMAAAYLIVEGIAVGQRYKALEDVIQKYKTINTQIDGLLQENAKL